MGSGGHREVLCREGRYRSTGGLLRTCSTEGAITRHWRSLRVITGVTPVLSGRGDGRNHEGNTPILARIDLCCRFKGIMTSSLSFRAAGHHRLNGALTRTDRDPTRCTKTGQEPEIAHLRGADVRRDQTREPIVIIVFRLCVPRLHLTVPSIIDHQRRRFRR
jgi:hypothetical protein